jgi:predicted transcriptional regulator of viral defense system
MAGGFVESELSVRKQRIETAIMQVAGRQKQLLRLDQLSAIGLGSRTVQARVARGRLHRIHRGVFATHGPPYSREQLYLAAVFACGRGTLLAGFCSASIFSLVDSPPTVPEVVNEAGTGTCRPGVTVHRSKVDPRDATRRHGIPCTSVARTIIDCAYRAGLDGTGELIMAADSAQLLNRSRLEQLADERRGRPGISHVLALITDDPVELRSRNERRMFSICRSFGIPLPLCNHRIELEGRTFIADFCWPDLRLIVEADSWRWHGGRLAAESDADRDQLLLIAGWRVVHFTRDQIKHHRSESGERLAALTTPAHILRS